MKAQLIAFIGAVFLSTSGLCAAPSRQPLVQGRPLSARERARLAEAARNTRRY